MNIKHALLCFITLSSMLSATIKAQSVNKSFLKRAFLTHDKCTYENLTNEQKEQCNCLNQFTTKRFAQAVLLSPETNSDNVEAKMTEFLDENFVTPFSKLYSAKEMSYKALRFAYAMREALVQRNKLVRQSIIEVRNDAKSLDSEEKEKIEKTINSAQEAFARLPHSNTDNFYRYDDYKEKISKKRERGPRTKIPYSQYDCSKDSLEYRTRPLEEANGSYIDNSIFAQSECRNIYKYTDNKNMINACHFFEGLTAEKFADEILLSPSTTKDNVIEKTTEFFNKNLIDHFDALYPIDAILGNKPYPIHLYNKIDLLRMEDVLHEAHKLKHQLIRQAIQEVYYHPDTLLEEDNYQLKNILFAMQQMYENSVLKNLDLNEKKQKNKQKEAFFHQQELQKQERLQNQQKSMDHLQNRQELYE